MNAITALKNELVRAGFRLARTNRHQVWLCPCGRHLYTSSSSHKHRDDNNAYTKLSRILRECKQNMEARQAA